MSPRTTIAICAAIALQACVKDQAQFCPPDFDLEAGHIVINGSYWPGVGAREVRSCPEVDPWSQFNIGFEGPVTGPYTLNDPQLIVEWDIPDWLEVLNVAPGNSGLTVRAPYRAPGGKVCLTIYSRCHDRSQTVCRGISVLDSNVIFGLGGGWKPPIPMAHAGVARVGNFIYAIGGRTEMDNPSPLLYRFDLSNLSWTDIGTVPSGNDFKDGNLLEVGGKIYVVEAELTWQFDPATMLWSAMAHFPGEPRKAWASGTLGDYLYKGLGTGRADWWAFHPPGNTWTLLDSFPGTSGISPVVLPIGNRLLVGGTKTSCPYYYPGQHAFYWFDPASNNWTLSAASTSTLALASFRLDDGWYLIDHHGVAWLDEVNEAWVQLGYPDNFNCQRKHIVNYNFRPIGYAGIGLDTMAIIFGEQQCGGSHSGIQSAIVNRVIGYRRY